MDSRHEHHFYPDLRGSLTLYCSVTKRAGATWTPAHDRYDGPFWRTLRDVDPGEQNARVAILSAHYGFRDANTEIEQYEARLTPEIAAAMKAGGLGNRWPLEASDASYPPSNTPANTSRQ